jgi:hypothetical protein
MLERFSFQWLKVVFSFYNIPEVILKDFSKLFDVPKYRILLQTPSIYAQQFEQLPREHECCFQVDETKSVIRFLLEFDDHESLQRFPLPLSMNYSTNVIGLWTLTDEWSTMGPTLLKDILKQQSNSTDTVLRVLARISSSDNSASKLSSAVNFISSKLMEIFK